MDFLDFTDISGSTVSTDLSWDSSSVMRARRDFIRESF